MNSPIRRDQLIAATAFVFVPTAAHAYVDSGAAGSDSKEAGPEDGSARG